MEPSHEIAEWLAELELTHLAETFGANRITFGMLTELTSSDLHEMGITALGDRKRLLSAIAKIPARRDGDGTPSADPAPSDPPPQPAPTPTEAASASLPEPAKLRPLLPVPANPLPAAVEIASIAPDQAAVSPATRDEAPVSSSLASKPPASERPSVEEAPRPAPAADDVPAPSRLPFWTRLLASKFLLVSIIVHIFFASETLCSSARLLAFTAGGPP